MDRNQTIKLWEKGKTDWNNWAEKQLAAKAALVENGDWATSQNETGVIQPLNSKTVQWMKSATAFFSTEQNPFKIKEKFDFDGWIFPHRVIFSFSQFEHSVSFDGTTFLGNVTFYRSVFENAGSFNSTVFNGNGVFVESCFEERANFMGARFERVADFGNCKFKKDTGFSSSHFKGAANFKNIRVGGNIWFGGAKFEARTIFDFSSLSGYSSFHACNIEHAFSLKNVKFANVPDFSQAHCKEAPLLDHIQIDQDHPSSKLIPALKRILDSAIKCFGASNGNLTETEERDKRKTTSLALRFRSLKRMAIQGHDHKNEIRYFAEELNANRKYDHSFLSADWFLSSAFMLLSDYGRSILRPILWWLPVTFLSTLSYLSSTTIPGAPQSLRESLAYFTAPIYHWLQEVIPTRVRVSWLPEPHEYVLLTCKGGSPTSAAFQLATSKGLVVPGVADKTLIEQAYECLYGSSVPFNISWTVGLQTLISTGLIFLLLLGIRNRFKLK
ncbi:MAG: hypothetical protein AXW12_16425 [Thalassospira sp. Nap_22]|nr:MAG: hypothetical protein AXW12_16425 [Thalassospira sp. Nap_22]